MKTLKFVLIALFVFACHKKKDDPKPVSPKNITVYITRGDYYPSSTNYYTVSSFDLGQQDNLGAVHYTYHQYVHTGPIDSLNAGDFNNYWIHFNVQAGGGDLAIPQGVNNTQIDSFYVHTIYQ